MIVILAMVATTAAEDAPSMYMVQNGDDIDLMVNTSKNVTHTRVCVHFNESEINATDVSFIGSPWQPRSLPGWGRHGGGADTHVSWDLTSAENVMPGVYKVATIDIDCRLVPGEHKVWLIAPQINNTACPGYPLMYSCNHPPPDAATISIDDGHGIVTLPIMISDAENVGAADVTLTYDPTVVKVTGVTDGDMDCTYTNTEHIDEGWIRVGATQSNNDGMSGDFILLNVELAPVGTDLQCSLELNVTTFKDSTPDCTTMEYTILNGVYTSSTKGDVNDDDVVDIADAMYIAKHVIGITGYETINENAADVNGDGIVDMSDSMYLMKHVIGITGYEELR